jgi:hypothetical protein
LGDLSQVENGSDPGRDSELQISPEDRHGWASFMSFAPADPGAMW